MNGVAVAWELFRACSCAALCRSHAADSVSPFLAVQRPQLVDHGDSCSCKHYVNIAVLVVMVMGVRYRCHAFAAPKALCCHGHGQPTIVSGFKMPLLCAR